MLKIALTGGIGTGKSIAAGYFAELGVPVIDADRLARELVVPGSPALLEIVAAFGPEVLGAEGELDRARLRHLVFSSPERRRRLEAILHPRIYAEMGRRAQALHAPYCILVIPLLLETGETAIADRILVVDAPEALQRKRVRARDGLNDAEFEAVLQAQVSRADRLRNADDVLVNDREPAQLKAAVAALHRRYLQRAAAGN